MRKILTIIFATMAVSGCAQQSFSVKENFPSSPPTNVTTHHFFLDGIGQHKVVDASAICGGSSKVVRTEVQQTFLNSFLRFITLGIYTPHEARVYCTKGGPIKSSS